MDRPADRRTYLLAMAAVLCLVTVLLFADATVAPATGWGAAGVVQVTATVASRIDVSFGADSLTVKANGPWLASASTADGERWSVSGGPTNGTELALPKGATGVEVCAR